MATIQALIPLGLRGSICLADQKVAIPVPRLRDRVAGREVRSISGSLRVAA